MLILMPTFVVTGFMQAFQSALQRFDIIYLIGLNFFSVVVMFKSDFFNSMSDISVILILKQCP